MRTHTQYIAAVALLSILATQSFAQRASDSIDIANRAVYLAKQISKLVVKQRDNENGSAPNTKVFEIVAKDRDGKEIDIPLEQAKKLYKWTAKDISGKTVTPKATLERIEEQTGKVKRAKNILRIIKKQDLKLRKVEVELTEKYSSYSTAAASEVGCKGSSWIARHPYLTIGGTVAAGGGIAAVGGGGSSDSETTTTGTSSGSAETTVPADTTDVTGTWVGTGGPDGDPIVLQLTQNGTSVSGTITIDDTRDGGIISTYPISGSVSGSSFSLSFTDMDGNNESSSGTVSWSGDTITGGDFSLTRA